MSLVRPIILQLLKFNIRFNATHIPGTTNSLSNAISRFQITPDVIMRWMQSPHPLSHQDTSRITRKLAAISQDLLHHSIQPTTPKIYLYDINTFINFILTPPPLPTTLYTLALFLDHLQSFNLSYKTIHTYTPALSFYHKIHSWPDLSTSFIISKLLHAIKTSNSAPKTWAPITLPIIIAIIDAIPFMSAQQSLTGLQGTLSPYVLCLPQGLPFLTTVSKSPLSLCLTFLDQDERQTLHPSRSQLT